MPLREGYEFNAPNAYDGSNPYANPYGGGGNSSAPGVTAPKRPKRGTTNYAPGVSAPDYTPKETDPWSDPGPLSGGSDYAPGASAGSQGQSQTEHQQETSGESDSGTSDGDPWGAITDPSYAGKKTQRMAGDKLMSRVGNRMGRDSEAHMAALDEKQQRRLDKYEQIKADGGELTEKQAGRIEKYENAIARRQGRRDAQAGYKEGDISTYDFASRGREGVDRRDINHLISSGYDTKEIAEAVKGKEVGKHAQRLLNKHIDSINSGGGNTGGNGGNGGTDDDEESEAGNNNGNNGNNGGNGGGGIGQGGQSYKALNNANQKAVNDSAAWSRGLLDSYTKGNDKEAADEFKMLNSAIGRRQQYYSDRADLAELEWKGDWRNMPTVDWSAPSDPEKPEKPDLSGDHWLDEIKGYTKKYG